MAVRTDRFHRREARLSNALTCRDEERNWPTETRRYYDHLSCMSASVRSLHVRLVERVRIGGDGLLQQPVEQHLAGAGVAPVEPEGVLVEVVGQVIEADVVVQSAGDPALEQ